MNTELTPAERLKEAMAQVRAKAEEKRIEKQISVLSTPEGANMTLEGDDATLLNEIKLKLEDIQGKPVYQGFTFNPNVESVVAIANTLQFMKGDLRDQVDAELYEVFTPQLRDAIIEAYGRLPYFKEATIIEMEGKQVVLDPEAPEMAAKGIPTDVKALQVYFDIVALNLGLNATYNITQQQADKAWDRAVENLRKAEILEEYKKSLES